MEFEMVRDQMGGVRGGSGSVGRRSRWFGISGSEIEMVWFFFDGGLAVVPTFLRA